MEYLLRDNRQLGLVKSPSFPLQHYTLDWSNDCYSKKEASDRMLQRNSCKKFDFSNSQIQPNDLWHGFIVKFWIIGYYYANKISNK